MFIQKDSDGQIIGYSKRLPEGDDWSECKDQEALDDFIKNGPAKTEAQLDNEDRVYYQLNTDPILIKALYAKAEELGLDLSEAITLKAARKAKRSN